MELPVAPANAPSRRDRERLARRRAMLDAAVAVFAEKGFQAATVDEIAERAEFGKGTLYNYFADKEALLFAIFDETVDEVVAVIEAYFAAATGDTRAVFRGLLATLLGHFSTRVPTFLVMVKEGHRLMFDENPEHGAYLHDQHERLARAVERPLRKAMGDGALRDLDAHSVAHILLGNVDGYLMYASGLCGPASAPHVPMRTTDQAADFLTTILFDGLLAPSAR